MPEEGVQVGYRLPPGGGLMRSLDEAFPVVPWEGVVTLALRSRVVHPSVHAAAVQELERGAPQVSDGGEILRASDIAAYLGVEERILPLLLPAAIELLGKQSRPWGLRSFSRDCSALLAISPDLRTDFHAKALEMIRSCTSVRDLASVASLISPMDAESESAVLDAASRIANPRIEEFLELLDVVSDRDALLPLLERAAMGAVESASYSGGLRQVPAAIALTGSEAVRDALLQAASRMAVSPGGVEDLAPIAAEAGISEALEAHILSSASDAGDGERLEALAEHGRSLSALRQLADGQAPLRRRRRALRSLLGHPDLGPDEEHDLVEAAAACMAFVEMPSDPARQRLSRHLEAYRSNVAAALGKDISLEEMLSDKDLRHLLVSLVRHTLRMRSAYGDAESWQRMRAQKLFESAWVRGVRDYDPERSPESVHVSADLQDPQRCSRACMPTTVEDGCDPTFADGRSSEVTTVEDGCDPTFADGRSSEADVRRCRERVQEISERFGRGERRREEYDAAGTEIWGDSQLLKEALLQHEDLPDRVLAAVKRASLENGTHEEPAPPVTSYELCAEMGSRGAASLLRRLQRIRVQWEPGRRPPRYVRDGISGIERRTAARFLLRDASETAWLLQRRPGECVTPEQARTLLRLDRTHLIGLPEQDLVEVLFAASRFRLELLEAALVCGRGSPQGYAWETASALLLADLNAAQTRAMVGLARTWHGTGEDLVEVARAVI